MKTIIIFIAIISLFTTLSFAEVREQIVNGNTKTNSMCPKTKFSEGVLGVIPCLVVNSSSRRLPQMRILIIL